MKTKLFHLPILLLLVSVLINQATAQTRKIVDMGGRTVEVPVTIKGVSVDKHCAMMLYAVAPEMALNIVFKPSDEAKNYLPKDYYEGKPFTNGSVEEILNLHPDVVFMSDELSPSVVDKANKLQEQIKIPVVLLEMNMEGYKKNIAFLGDLLNKKQQASLLVNFVKKYLDVIEARAKTISTHRQQVYYAEGANGLSTDPSGSKHSQIIDFVGATNVAQTDIIPGKGLSAVSMEQVMVWNPQIILCWTGDAESLTTYKYVTSDPLWSNIAAVKNKQVYQIPWLPFGWFDRPPGTNRIIGTIWTANLLYPNIFKYDMVAVTQEYFKLFYHFNLSAADAKTFINPKPIVKQ